jgi:beta-glucosidase-like glycosyl hydrolase
MNDGLVSESVVGSSARRVLKLARALNRFQHPEESPESEAVNPDRDVFICNAVAEGMVVLKNEGSALPLSLNANVAIIGHLAKVASPEVGAAPRSIHYTE